MKLVEMSCPKCSAKLEVNADLKFATCNYCGNQFILDDEVIRVQHELSEQAGYNFEKGRIKAQEEAQERARRIAAADAEKRRLEAEAYSAKQKRATSLSRMFAMLGAFIAIMGFLIILLGLSGGTRASGPLIYGCGLLVAAIVCAVLNVKINKRYGLVQRKSDPLVIAVIVVIAFIRLISGPR